MPEIPPPPMPPPPAKSKIEQGFNIFGSASKPSQQEQPSALTEQLTNLSGRLRVFEERISEMRRKLLLIENNMLAANKKNQTDTKIIQNEVLELKHTVQQVEDKMITIIKELRLMSPKEDLQVLKRYIELWNPTTFITREQLDKILDERAGKPREERHNYDSPSSTINKPKL